MRAWRRLSSACLLLAVSHSALAQPAVQPSLTLGVVPQFPAVETQRRWLPVTESIGRACSVQIRLEISTDIPEFEGKFLDGKFELTYVNPYHAVMAHKAQGYVPLVRDGEKPLKGVLVVQKDSPIKRLSELSGSTIAFPAPNAFGASLYMLALLEREHQVRFTPDYVKTHGNAYRHVVKGEAAAAGGVMATFNAERPEIREQLRVLYETPGAAPHPLMAHPRLDTPIRRCITEHLTQASPTMSTLMAAIQMSQPVRADYARDYQPLEKLALEKYVVHGAP